MDHHEIELARLEGLQADHRVLEVFEGDRLEVELVTPGRVIGRPVGGILRVGDRLAGHHRVHRVGTGAHRHGHGPVAARRVEGVLGIKLPTEHRQLGGDHVQLTVRPGETEADLPLAEDVGAVDVAEVDLIKRVGLVTLQGLQGELDVLGGDRRAVGEAGLGVEGEGHRFAIRGENDILGDQPVLGEGLVQAGHGQGFEHVPGQTGRCVALEGEGVHFVETAQVVQGQAAALAGRRVDIGETAELRRILEGAVDAHPVGGEGRPAQEADGAQGQDGGERGQMSEHRFVTEAEETETAKRGRRTEAENDRFSIRNQSDNVQAFPRDRGPGDGKEKIDEPCLRV